MARQDVPALPGSEPDTLVEPDVGVSPVDANIAVAAAHDGRYPDGGAVGIETSWTHDGSSVACRTPKPRRLDPDDRAGVSGPQIGPTGPIVSRMGENGSLWPTDAETLIAEQRRIAAAIPRPVSIDVDRSLITGIWVCFPRGTSDSADGAEQAWCAAYSTRARTAVEQRVFEGTVGAPYVAGLIALRLGPLLDRLVRSLIERPDVLLLDATARDHPRRAGLAWHLGAALNIPTIGVTHRPLVAGGDLPDEQRGATSPIRIGATIVGCWLRTQPGVRPLVVHPGWQVDLDTAVAVVMSVSRWRTPEPLRQARQLARSARARQTFEAGRYRPDDG